MPVEVESQVRLNKLVSFDEETTETTFDFFFRLYWTDERFDIPSLFAALPEWISEGGLELRVRYSASVHCFIRLALSFTHPRSLSLGAPHTLPNSSSILVDRTLLK